MALMWRSEDNLHSSLLHTGPCNPTQASRCLYLLSHLTSLSGILKKLYNLCVSMHSCVPQYACRGQRELVEVGSLFYHVGPTD